MRLAVFFCILCMFAVYSAQSAPLYRWVDAQGKVHYTDQPPPASARQIEEKKMGGLPIEVDPPYATRQAVKKFPVALYNADCGEDCVKAREHLLKRGIPFDEKNAATPAVAAELKKLAGGLVVPVLAIGKAAPLKGYNADTWDAALDEAGYPRSAPIGMRKPKAQPQTDAGEQKPAVGGKQ